MTVAQGMYGNAVLPDAKGCIWCYQCLQNWQHDVLVIIIPSKSSCKKIRVEVRLLAFLLNADCYFSQRVDFYPAGINQHLLGNSL